MITTEKLKEVQKEYEEQGLLHFDAPGLDATGHLSEVMLNIINIWNVKYYTKNQNVPMSSPGRHRSTCDLYRIVKYYRPEVSLEEMMDVLWELNAESKIWIMHCSTIGRCTYFPVGSRYGNYAYGNVKSPSDRCYNRKAVDQSNRFNMGDHFEYFHIDKINERKNNKKLKEMANATVVKPVKGGFQMRIRSRHPSHDVLRKGVPKLTFRSVLRLGSTTEVDGTVEDGGNIVEINSIEGIRNSSDKKRMKDCFMNADAKTAEWFIVDNSGRFQKQLNDGTSKQVSKDDLPYPIVAKHRRGSRGTGNYKLDTRAKLDAFLQGKTVSDYIFEKFYTYSREYRAHVTSEGCFYTCRKMLKDGTAQENKWQRHDDNCVWIREENELFDKPSTWNNIIADCVKCLEALGLDIGAFDIKVQSAKDKKGVKRPSPEWIIIESCSAPSFGEVTAQKYIEVLPKLATRLARECNVI